MPIPVLSITLHFQNIVRILILIFVASFCSWWGDKFNFPIPWLLIPLILGIIIVIFRPQDPPFPKFLSTIAQAIIAIITASRFSFDSFVHAQSLIFPLIICVFITGSLSILNGYLISKWADIDPATSFLGCIPGAGPSLVAMSDEMEADAIAVTILQYLRILMVSTIVPIFAGIYASKNEFLPKYSTLDHKLFPSLPPSISLGIIIIVVIVSINIGKLIKLPSNLFLAPFLGCLLLFYFLPYRVEISPIFFQGALVLLGLSIGLKFAVESLRKLIKAVYIEIVLVLCLIISCFITGYGFHLLTKVDTFTALLGTTPGGLTAMIATVIELGGDSALVLTMQMTRMLLILILSPFIVNFLKKRFTNLKN